MGAAISCCSPAGAEPADKYSAPRAVPSSAQSRNATRLHGAHSYHPFGPEAFEFEDDEIAGEKGYRLMRNKRTSETVMVKFVNTSENNIFPRGIEREIVNHRSLNHPNIVHFYEVLVLLDSLGIVSEYPKGGSLADSLKANGPVTESQAKILFVQLLAGMKYCHNKTIWHRDLRVENLFLDSTNGEVRLRISGFGYSKCNLLDGAPDLETMKASDHSEQLDNPPELLDGAGMAGAFDGSKLDIWGAGLCLFKMLTGKHPFEDDHEQNNSMRSVARRIKACAFEFPQDIILSRECEDLIRKIFVADPERRPSIAELQAMPWLTGAKVPQDAADKKPKSSAQRDEDINLIVERARQRKMQEAAARARRGMGGHGPMHARKSSKASEASGR